MRLKLLLFLLFLIAFSSSQAICADSPYFSATLRANLDLENERVFLVFFANDEERTPIVNSPILVYLQDGITNEFILLEKVYTDGNGEAIHCRRASWSKILKIPVIATS